MSGQSSIGAAEVIRINGTGAGVEMLKPLIDAYGKSHPEVTFATGKPLGSSGAVKALLAEALDIALTSQPLKSEDVAKGARVRAYGKTPLTIVTSNRVSIQNISTKELVNIYSGVTRAWPNGERIGLILRPRADADTKVLQALSPEMHEAVVAAHTRQGMIVAVTDPESNQLMVQGTNRLGTAGLVNVVVSSLPVNLLRLNGVLPSTQALADGKYPLGKDIHFVTTGTLSRSVDTFLAFVYSQAGRSIVEQSGVLVPPGSTTGK